MKQVVVRIPGPGGRGWTAKAMAFAVAVLFLVGCAPPAYDATDLKLAAQLGDKEQRWDEARPLIRAHLLRHPDDPVAHFYYGLSYLHRKDAQLTLAEGELLTAQVLLERNGGIPEGATEMDLTVFTGELFQKTALVYMRAYYESFRFNVPPEIQRDLLKKAVLQVETGLQTRPDSLALKDYLGTLKELLGRMPEGVPDIITQNAEKGSAI